MDPTSPLTRDVHESLQPKIIQLYSTVFTLTQQDQDEPTLPSEGFWSEFFLLKPSRRHFHDILEPLSAGSILSINQQTRNYIRRSIYEIKSGVEPRAEHALENLAAFLVAVLAKRFPNPSTDVIEIMAGLEDIDKVMTDLVSSLDAVISNHKSNSKSISPRCRTKAVECAIAAVAGSYQTSLLTYFIQKDLFHGLMKLVQSSPEVAPSALCLLGLLANYNKFEVQNVYQSRMEDFINEEVMVKLVEGSANTCGDIRDAFIAVQDDTPAQWSIVSTLSYVGLRALAPKPENPPPPTEEEAKILFNALPPPGAASLLATYSFTQANKIFATQLISTDKDDDLESRLAAFLSVTSYLCHHAFRSPRMECYALLTLFTIRNLSDDSMIAKRLSSPDCKIITRLARQRPPHLPHVMIPRIATTVVFDIITDALSHNLRKRISIPLYSTALSVLHSMITQLANSRTRLPHHWSYIWLSLVSLLRFLTTYAADLLASSRIHELRTHILTPLTSILTFSLLHGDSFLPDPPSYDDLFYKLLELDSAPSTLQKLTSAYEIASLPTVDKLRRATEALISISGHYASLLSQSKRKIHQSPREIQKLIGEGHETLGEVVDNISVNGSGRGAGLADAGFGSTEKWREGVWKMETKKIVRTVVEDARVLISV